MVFFVAAALKGHELATGPLLGEDLLASRPVLIALVEFEWVLGLCMLFGLYPRRTWQVALVCFSVFACVSFYKGLAGDAWCGCFGRLEVSPWYTLALDVGAVIALLVWPPRDHAPGDEPVRGDAKRLVSQRFDSAPLHRTDRSMGGQAIACKWRTRFGLSVAIGTAFLKAVGAIDARQSGWSSRATALDEDFRRRWEGIVYYERC